MFGQGQIAVHDGQCKACGHAALLPMSAAVVVKRRFMWLCPNCRSVNTIKLSREHARKLKATFHRAGGTRISPEELQEFAANLHRLDEAVMLEIG